MASFTNSFDPEDIMGGLVKFENSDEIAKKMVSSAQDVMASSIQRNASMHRYSGHMASSVYKTKIVIDKEGCIIGRVGFAGTEGTVVSKRTGKRFDRSNWIKAFRIEYGTTKQVAHPFVRPAIQGSESEMKEAMQKVFNSEVNK